MILSKEIDEKGYKLFRSDGPLPKIDFINDSNQVNPMLAKRFVDRVILRRVNDAGEGAWQCQYVKFRVSVKSNSSDASAFHRDVFGTNGPKGVRMYTALCYLDPARMQFVRGSHHMERMPLAQALRKYTDVETLDMHPGDVLIFDNSLLHRGVFTSTGSTRRRLVQVFDVARTPSEFHEHMSRTTHVPAAGDFKLKGYIAQTYSKSKVLSAFPGFIGYLNAATGYGPAHDDVLGSRIYSSEGQSPRTELTDAFGQDNTYVLVVDGTTDATDDQNAYVSYVCYRRPYAAYGGVLLLLMTLLASVIMFVLQSVVESKTR